MQVPLSNAFGAEAGAQRAWLTKQVATGGLAPNQLQSARAVLGLTPSPRGWLALISAALGAAGFSLLAAALLFAVAFNWDALGHFSRFALAQMVLALFVALAWWRGTHTVAGEAALAAACLATGALLALFGQTYQTGADPYSLFVVWGVLILPWLLHARRASLWLLWLIVANTGLSLFCAQVLGEGRWVRLWGHIEWSAALIVGFNGVLLAVFERVPSLGALTLGRAVPRSCALLVIGGATAILAPFVLWRHHGRVGDAQLMCMALFALAAFGALALAYWKRRDVLILAAASLAAIGIGYTFMTRIFTVGGDAFGFFLLSAAYWIGSIAMVVVWLRDLVRAEGGVAMADVAKEAA